MKKNNKEKPIETKSNDKQKYAVSVTGVSVFKQGDSLFGEDSTQIELIESDISNPLANCWIRISQGDKWIDINLDEWPAIHSAIELIINTHCTLEAKFWRE